MDEWTSSWCNAWAYGQESAEICILSGLGGEGIGPSRGDLFAGGLLVDKNTKSNIFLSAILEDIYQVRGKYLLLEHLMLERSLEGGRLGTLRKLNLYQPPVSLALSSFFFITYLGGSLSLPQHISTIGDKPRARNFP